MSKKLVILGMGGTIAGLAPDPRRADRYKAGQLSPEQLLASLAPPSTDSFACVVEQVAQVDSKDMAWSLLHRLALRCRHWLAQPEVSALVIMHGTDTLEECAWFLHSVLKAADQRKPVVLTCAMRPANAPHADGPRNLRDAIQVANDAQSRGVLLVCAGEIHEATQLQKTHSSRLNAFESGPAGPVGRVDQEAVHWLQIEAKNWAEMPAGWAYTVIKNEAENLHIPWVEIITSTVGCQGVLVELLVRAGVRGIVVAATGNGTVHQDLEHALRTALAAGVRVLRATRCMSGGIRDGGDDLLPHAGPLSPVKARVRLVLELMMASP